MSSGQDPSGHLIENFKMKSITSTRQQTVLLNSEQQQSSLQQIERRLNSLKFGLHEIHDQRSNHVRFNGPPVSVIDVLNLDRFITVNVKDSCAIPSFTRLFYNWLQCFAKKLKA